MTQPPYILIIVALAMFMEAVDSTALNTAIPVMADSLSTNPIDLKLALISYLLSLAIFIPISGWVSDKYGAKRVFMCAIVVFTLSSIACATTSSLLGLVCTRALQGVGGSMTLPVGRLIILQTFKRYEIIDKMTVVTMIASLGMLIGPFIGGLITHYLSWRWIFWVNIPIGLLILLLSIKGLPSLSQHCTYRLDKLGFIFFSSGLSLLTLGLSLLSESRLDSYPAILMLIIASLLLIAYYIRSKKQAHPIVNTALFRIKTFSIATAGNLACRISFGGAPFLLPLTFQLGLQIEPQLSGLLISPMAVGVFVIKPLARHILCTLGYKKLLFLNTFCISLSIGLFSTISATTSLYTISFFTFLYGVFIALQFTGMNSLAYADIATEHQSSATSIMSTIQQLAVSFGVAIAALFVRLFEHINQTSLLTLSVLQHTFLLESLMTCFSAFIFMKLHPKDGEALIKKPQ